MTLDWTLQIPGGMLYIKSQLGLRVVPVRLLPAATVHRERVPRRDIETGNGVVGERQNFNNIYK